MTDLERGLSAIRDGDKVEGCRLLTKWLTVHPEHAEAHNVLGRTLASLDRTPEAIETLLAGVAANSDYAPLRFSLGTLLVSAGRCQEALVQLQAAVSLEPMRADAWVNLCAAARTLGQLSLAESAGRRATKVDPGFAQGWINLGNALMDQGKLDQALPAFAQVPTSDPNGKLAMGNGLLGRCYIESKPEGLVNAHREYGAMMASAFPERPFAERAQNSKIRIGYVSGDFRLHSVIYFFGSLLNSHDRSKFDVYLYSDVEAPDATTARTEQAATHFANCRNLSDEELWAKIRADHIDVLVDLGAHTGRRLSVFALRAAPTQVTWLGYPFTTGLSTMDFRITDAIADPPDSDEHYSERLLRLNGPFLCYQPPVGAPAITPAPILKNGYLTFGSFNHLAKLSEETVVLFSAILHECAGSKLLLKCKSLSDMSTAKATIDRFMQYDISPQRLILKGRIGDPIQHLAEYANVDVALDPFPYNGTTTTLEALWMGVPVLTMRGHWHATRVGASLMSYLGLTTLVAENPDSLLILARELSKQPETFVELRQVLRQMLLKSPLCDQTRFARDFEDVLMTAMQLRTSLSRDSAT
jgi:protein O-GlcNAc transferase